jgi:hypothetical protein
MGEVVCRQKSIPQEARSLNSIAVVTKLLMANIDMEVSHASTSLLHFALDPTREILWRVFYFVQMAAHAMKRILIKDASALLDGKY